MVLLFSLLAAVLGVVGVVGIAMTAKAYSTGDEQGQYGWGVLALLSIAGMFACLLFTAQVEGLGPLLVGRILFK